MRRQASSFNQVFFSLLLILLVGCAGDDVFFEPNMDFGSVRSVAVLPFQNLSNEDEAAERVRDTFMGMLLATGALYVVPPGEVARGLSKLPRFPPQGPAIEQIKQLSTILEVDAIFTGVVREYGTVRSGTTSANVISVSVDMFETTDGLIVWSASSTKGGIGVRDRLFGGGGAPMNTVTVRAVDDLLDKLFD
jgi:TolB-like protein